MRKETLGQTTWNHNLYLIQLREELKFLWLDAHETDDEDLRERKLNQYWELYRLYQEQVEDPHLM